MAARANLCYRERIVLPLWRSMASLNLMLPKEERKAMLLRLFNDDSPLVDHNKERNAQKANAEAQGLMEEESSRVELTGDAQVAPELDEEESSGVPLPKDTTEIVNGSENVELQDSAEPETING